MRLLLTPHENIADLLPIRETIVDLTVAIISMNSIHQANQTQRAQKVTNLRPDT